MAWTFDPSVFTQGAQMQIGAQNRMFDMLSGAVQNYSQRQQAMAEQARKDATDPQKIYTAKLMGQPVTPEQDAILQGWVNMQSAEMSANPVTGEMYSKFQLPMGGAPMGGGMQPAQAPSPAYGGGNQADIAALDSMPAFSNPAQKQKYLEKVAEGQAERDLGKKDIQAAKPAVTRSFDQMRFDTKNMVGNIDKAIKQTGDWSAGAGSALSAIPASAAKNLQATLRTIQADSAFSTLQAMRDASKTGGALGAVSDTELGLLRDAKTSLDQAQSSEQLKENLKNYKRIRERALHNVAQAYYDDYGVWPDKYSQPSEAAGMSDEELMRAINGQ